MNKRNDKFSKRSSSTSQNYATVGVEAEKQEKKKSFDAIEEKFYILIFASRVILLSIWIGVIIYVTYRIYRCGEGFKKI